MVKVGDAQGSQHVNLTSGFFFFWILFFKFYFSERTSPRRSSRGVKALAVCAQKQLFCFLSQPCVMCSPLFFLWWCGCETHSISRA